MAIYEALQLFKPDVEAEINVLVWNQCEMTCNMRLL